MLAQDEKERPDIGELKILMGSGENPMILSDNDNKLRLPTLSQLGMKECIVCLSKFGRYRRSLRIAFHSLHSTWTLWIQLACRSGGC